MANEPMDPETKQRLDALKKRKRLGTGLGEILEQSEASEGLGKTLFADTGSTAERDASGPDVVDDSETEEDPDAVLTLEWDKLNPQIFTMVNIVETDVYYQGPNRSSRVRRFNFSTEEPVTINNQKALENGTLEGYVTVEFIKRAYNKPSNRCKYGPMPVKDFIEFKESVSLGQAIVDVLEPHTFVYV